MRARVAAWAVVALTSVCVVLDTVFTAANQSLLSEETWAFHGWPLATLATLGSALMGALVIDRYPRHPIGWLLLVPGAASVSLAAEAYSDWVLHGGGPGSDYAGHVVGWMSLLLGGPLAIWALTLIFLISPDGHLPSRRWRWVARASTAGLVFYTAGVLAIDPSEFDVTSDEGVGVVAGLLSFAGITLIGLSLIASAVSLFRRLRRARDDARRQLLWIVSPAASLAFGLVFAIVVSGIQGEDGTWLATTPLFCAYLAFPVCTAVAVLRHRLFDIDLIVNRALVLALATVSVAVGYVLVVVVIGAAVGGGTGGFWPSLLATALVAMAFQPLRRRVVRVADRLAFGAAAAPYEALADFSRRLGESPDPATLLPAVADAAGHAVNARRATTRLDVEGGPDRMAVWPPFGADGLTSPGVEIPVMDGGERLGSITVEMPAGRALRGSELQLLSDLADQAAIAFRNARLSAELAGRVEQLKHHTLELVESRRRLITAGDAERSRLERSIARQVVPHLAPLPDQLRRLSRAGTDGADAFDPSLLEPLVASSAAALEALREITRGVFPAQLARSGLAAALASHLGRAGGSARLVVDDSAAGRRFDPRVEAAAYFCVVEAARDLAPPVEVRLTATGDHLEVEVRGDGHGGLPVAHMRDRVEAAGGSVAVTAEGARNVVQVRLPAPAPEPVAP